MALGDTIQENSSVEGVDRKGITGSGSSGDTGEEQPQVPAPPGICDICAEFYHFLVSGKH